MASADSAEIYDQEELKRLYGKAAIMCDGIPMNWPKNMNLYRNQEPGYFDWILLLNGGVMEPNLKDQSGDPRNPINGVLKGIFFMANVYNDTLEPPTWALFGPVRIHVPLWALLENLGTWRMYFADFYCLAAYTTGRHYVTLVLCESGSDEDKFCQANLFRLPLDNPFFRTDGTNFSVNSELWIEIFYTKEININEMHENKGAFYKTIKNVKGTKSPNGIPKNPNCSFCNLLDED